MPFHSKEALERWVEEFTTLRDAGELAKVVVQDGARGADTGLVVIPLVHAKNTVYIEPTDAGENLSWSITIEPATEATVLTSFELNALTHELQVAAELCAYLEERSLGHYEPGRDPEPSDDAASRSA